MDTVTEDGKTPLSRAIQQGVPKMVELLIRHGVALDRRVSCELAPIELAIGQGRFKLARALCDAGAETSDIAAGMLRTACRYADWDFIGPLLLNSDQFRQDPSFRSACLVEAVTGSNSQVVANLLRDGVDSNSRDGDGDPVLLTAIRRRDETVVSLLLDHDADPNAENSEGVTPVPSLTLR